MERYVNTALVKVSMLYCALSPFNPKYREVLLKRLRTLNVDSNPQLQDIRLLTTLLLSISSLETKPYPLTALDLPFRKYL